jgi:hypothetical protein
MDLYELNQFYSHLFRVYQDDKLGYQSEPKRSRLASVT